MDLVRWPTLVGGVPRTGGGGMKRCACVSVYVCYNVSVTVIATSHDEEMYVCVCSNVSVNGIVSFVSE